MLGRRIAGIANTVVVSIGLPGIPSRWAVVAEIRSAIGIGVQIKPQINEAKTGKRVIGNADLD